MPLIGLFAYQTERVKTKIPIRARDFSKVWKYYRECSKNDKI